jgi:hypothetical protein
MYIIPNDQRFYQTAIKYTNILYFKALQNIPKLGFLEKINHLATLETTRVKYKGKFFFQLVSNDNFFVPKYFKLCKQTNLSVFLSKR